MQRFHRPSLLLILLFVLFSFAGCTIKLVADYDAVSFEEILIVGKKVDKFYGDLLETNSAERPYSKFSERYVDIETDIRSLITRNQARAFNAESTEISQIILRLWVKYKDNHKRKNTYTDGTATLDRNRFQRLFAAAASAEQAKNLNAGDLDAARESE